MTGAVRLVACALLLQAIAAGGAPDTRPLPDPKTFLAAVRQNLARAEDAQSVYAYKERRTDLDLNPFGHIGTAGTRIVEVIPNGDGMTVTRRLIERDGKPTTALPNTRHLNSMPRGKALIDDVADAIDVAIDHREVTDGRDTIVLTFKPEANAKPRTREGKLVHNFRGRIWIDEQAQEVERVDAEAIDDITVGLGVLGRLNEGAFATVRRQAVDGTVWLPVSVRFKGEGRELLFRKLVIDFALDWFDYRKVKN
jgi:hypothetical protein